MPIHWLVKVLVVIQTRALSRPRRRGDQSSLGGRSGLTLLGRGTAFKASVESGSRSLWTRLELVESVQVMVRGGCCYTERNGFYTRNSSNTTTQPGIET